MSLRSDIVEGGGAMRERASRQAATTQDVVSIRARMCSIMRKCWHFCRAVVIRMQCSRSPRALIDIATHSRLGGQHGEEAKEGSEGGEEGREKDEAPEEEVTTRRFTVFDFERRR